LESRVRFEGLERSRSSLDPINRRGRDQAVSKLEIKRELF